MLKHPQLTETRVRQFVEQVLQPLIYVPGPALNAFFCEDAMPTEAMAREAAFGPVSEGFRWGPAYRSVWFRLEGSIPEEWRNEEIALKLEVGGERTVWRDNCPVWGVNEPHSYYHLPQTEKNIEIFVQAYGDNPDVRVHGDSPDRQPLPFTFSEARIYKFDRELWELYLDCKFNLELLNALPESDVARAHILTGLNTAVNRFSTSRRESIADARRAIREWCSQKRSDKYQMLTAVGHAHLDTAWLWPLEITHKKMAHTVATQLELMEQYPEYVFVHSQASQYEWLENEYPELFSKVKKKVADGQWEPLGSMWVEADCNLASGESLVRQFLYGKRYFAEKFGIDTKDMWLPDVFGYSAAIPQILKKCNIDRFLTQKMSWSQFNKFPHNTFWWQGIDGTRVWTHFPPADTYCGMCTPREIFSHLQKNKDHARSDQALYVFGYGDGGGGPTAEQIELLRRAQRAPGMPQIAFRKAAEFFEDAKEKSRDLSVWAGELYLEYHRGTYTTQANTKKGNRAGEFLLRDAELLATFAKSEYPKDELENIWKLLLLNQFHDILPGSSIREVYEQSEADYEEIAARSKQLIEKSMRELVLCENPADLENPMALFTFATLPSQGAVPAEGLETKQSVVCNGASLPCQLVDDFGEKKLIFPVPEGALTRVALCELSDEPAPMQRRSVARGRRIENDLWSVRFDSYGNISSVHSMEDQTEYIQEGAIANCFQLFEDKPHFWSAWDIDAYALETKVDLIRGDSFEVVEKGPVRVAAVAERQFGNSKIVQKISLGPTPGIRFDTWIDWHEHDKMLKVAFPVNVNSPRATYEIQFGSVDRPTHRNTSWDVAKFESCAHKWVDLSEGDHGVALLNDCKYGHDIYENTIRLTLLRSPKAPDPMADMGVHRFTYVLLPHFGPHNWANIVQAAYALNAPVHALMLNKKDVALGQQSPLPLISCEDRNVVIDTVKRSEADDGIVVRMYEAHNARGSAEMHVRGTFTKAAICNLLEEEERQLEVADGIIQFDYLPFEIITLKLSI